MKKNKMKWVTLMICLLAFMSGCSNNKETKTNNSDGNEYVYVPTYVEVSMDEDTLYNVSYTLTKEGAYYVSSNNNDEINLVSINMQDGTSTKIPINLSSVEEKLKVKREQLYTQSLVNKTNGGFLLLLNSFSEESQAQKLILVDLTKEGVVNNSFFINDIVKENDNIYVQYIATDKEDNIYINCGETEIYVTNTSGELLGTVSASDWIVGMGETGNGTVAVLYFGNQNSELAEVDLSTKSMNKKVENIAFGNGTSSVFPGSDGKVLINAGINLKEYDLATGKGTDLLNWIDSNINPENLLDVTVAEDGKLYVLLQTYTETGSEIELVTLTPQKKSEIEEKTVLTYGTLYLDQNIQRKIIEFNKKSDTYKVAVKIYGEEDYAAGQDLLLTDIASGKGIDIIDFGAVSDPKMMGSKGVLADLTPFLESDSEVSKEDFIEGTLSIYSDGEKIYGIPTNFYIMTILASTDKLNGLKKWNVNDIMKIKEELGSDTELFEYTTNSSMLFTLVMLDLDSYIDWDNGVCSFNTEEFKNVLRFSNSFPSEFSYDQYGDSTYAKISKGSLFAFQASIDSIESMQMYSAMYGNNVTFIGFPTNGESGNRLVSTGTTLGMLNSSEHKDGVYEFLREFYKKGTSNNNSWGWGFPSRKDMLEEQFAKAMKEETYTDEEGNEVVTSKGTWGYDDFSFEIMAATEEEINKIKELINSADSGGFTYNEKLYAILSEEASSYFSGAKSVEEVADVIQSRIQIYVSENR
ncbi:MAG: ABC transporter substrate-binding protein [Lachnospiraceae bacterium]